MAAERTDVISVRDLLVRGVVGVDNWERQKKQDIVINLSIFHDIHASGTSDDVGQTINYSDVCKTVVEFVEASHYKSVEGLAEGIAQFRPYAELRVDDRGVYHSEDRVFIVDLRVRLIVGVNPPEREEKQDVIVNLSMWSLGRALLGSDRVPRAYNYRTISHMVTHMLEASAFKTIEALATAVAELLVTKCHIRRVTVRVNKPSALLFAKSAGVEITRDQSHFGGPPLARSLTAGQVSSTTAAALTTMPTVVAPPLPILAPLTLAAAISPQQSCGTTVQQHIVFVALGSNVGDRAANINKALEWVSKTCDCLILDTSFLYETPPAYVTDQPMFLNAACKITTTCTPRELLVALKSIERELGRVPTIPNGPRVIDLDILFYDDIENEEDDLVIPHPLLHEREFVLRPLHDIAASHEHPKLQKTVEHMWRHLKNRPTTQKVLPIGPNKQWQLGSRTYIMGILNVTPDSFSDGGMYLSVDAAVNHAKEMIRQGAHIIDIGGMSTKPNAAEVSIDEELQRVIPVIRRLREECADVLISVDTWHAQVAEAAVAAGANMINDVTGGHRDPDMYRVMAAANVPVCLMHMRGNATTMLSAESKVYPEDDVVVGVRQELAIRVHSAIRAGVRRWHILVDPGLGFAKHSHQSLQLVRSLSQMVAFGQELEGFPMLVGPSRKGFIGTVINKDPSGRAWGTAATCAALIAEGVDVLRVHDIGEMVDVVKMSDAIWRPVLPVAPDAK